MLLLILCLATSVQYRHSNKHKHSASNTCTADGIKLKKNRNGPLLYFYSQVDNVADYIKAQREKRRKIAPESYTIAARIGSIVISYLKPIAIHSQTR